MEGVAFGVGHNSGRVDEPGKAWRTHAWRKARRDLMPKLPIEVIRRRVKRAAELGLPYKTYAGLRASSGDDLIGFMFSSNALDVLRRTDVVPAVKADKVQSLVGAKTIALTYRSVLPEQVCPPVDFAAAVPDVMAPWVQTRAALERVFVKTRMPSSRMVLITEQTLEREWVSAGRMAGVLPTTEFFAT